MRPLIIQCGEGKLDGEHRVIDLYTGPLWSSVRAVVAELGGELPLPVYVMSAKYGLVRADKVIETYNAVLAKRPRKNCEVSPEELVPLLREQMSELGADTDFVGGALYAETLRAAGFNVTELDTRGIGYKRQSVKQHIRSAAA